jgi:hypothetical protein
MGYEDNIEKGKASAPSTSSVKMTLQKAIEMGEYDESYLSTFPEWHTLGRYVQFQMLRQALENRRRQLLVQWSEINNMLDFSKKPYLKEALKNIEDQLRQVEADREKIYFEYSKA